MALDTLPNWPAMSLAEANAAIAASDTFFKVDDGEVGGVPMKVYVNVPATVRDIVLLGMTTYPDRDYIVYENERVTFGAMGKAIAHFAHYLSETCGIEKGDRVAIAMRNYPQWPVAFFAALSLGAIATPMNSWWSAEELAYGLDDSSPRVLILDNSILNRLSSELPGLTGLERIVVARAEGLGDEPRAVSLESLIGTSADWAGLSQMALPDVPLGADDDATIMYTSGTTGKPKGALCTHRAIISNIANSQTCAMRAFLRRGEPIPAPDPNDQMATLLSIPFFHVTGAFAVLVPAMLLGAKVVIMYKWDADKALPIIEREKVNLIGGVPAIAWQILEHPDLENYDLSSITKVSYGGAPSAPELVSTIKQRLPEAAPGNGWGMTETCATACFNTAEDYENRPDSAGAPPLAVELKIVGPNGETLPAGEVGELWCKGPQNAKLYWNKPEASEKTFIDGWVVTGDLARLDEEGFLYLVDRAKDMLIRGGENIYCIEVENVLFDHPAIIDAAIVGIPHKVLGEEVGAIVQVKAGETVTEADVQAHVRSQMAAFKVPVEVQFQSEPLPRNANGKVLKPELRERFTPRG